MAVIDPAGTSPPPHLSISPPLFTYWKCLGAYPVKNPAHVKRERPPGERVQSKRPPVGAANPRAASPVLRIPLGALRAPLRAPCHRKGSGDGGEERGWNNGGLR